MKRITIVGALAALVVLAALATVTTTSKHTVPAAYASTGCGVATLNGNYGFIQPAGFTTLHGSSSSEVPWQFVGVENFNGTGGTSVTFTSAVNGAISQNQPSGGGTYTVSLDCTGTIVLPPSSSLPTGYAANIVIIGGGAEVFAISTGTGDTATVVLKKQ